MGREVNLSSPPSGIVVARSVTAGCLAGSLMGLLLSPSALLVDTLSLGGLLGALLGLVLGLLQTWLSRGRLLRWLWVLGGIGGGLLAARAVGAFSRLQGEHRAMALGTIVVGVLGGGALGSCLVMLQSNRERPPLSGRVGWRVRGTVAALGFLGTAALGVYESTAFWLRGYPAARQALFASSWVLAFVVGRMLLDGVSLPRRLMTGTTLGLAALSALGFFGILRKGESRFAALIDEGPSEHWVTLLRGATDWDRDGASGWFGGGDCAPLNPHVSPQAREIPGNGVDDNCRFGDAARAALTQMSQPAPPSTPSPLNVLLVTLDAVRADHTTPYGYRRETTPNLARLARGSTVFRRAYPPGGWTCLTLPAVFGGVHARRLRYVSKAVTTEARIVDFPWSDRLRPGENIRAIVSTADLSGRWALPSALRSRGMTTAVVTNRFISLMVRGLGAGWDTLEFAAGDDDEDVAELAVSRLRILASTPFFLWVHFYNVHDPQTHHEGIAEFGLGMLDMYDHEIRSTDHALGRLLAAVAEVSSRPTAVIVAADHGEAFHMGYQFHGNDLFEDALRIPLLVRVPGRPPGEVDSVVTLLDLAPTILALTETPRPAGLEGVSLLTPRPERVVITDLWRMNEHRHVYLDQIAVIDRKYRLIFDRKKQNAILTSTDDLSRPPKRLSGTPAPDALTHELQAYLEQELLAP